MTLEMNGLHPPPLIREDRDCEDNYAGEGSDFTSMLRAAEEHYERTGREQRVHAHDEGEACNDDCTRWPEQEGDE